MANLMNTVLRGVESAVASWIAAAATFTIGMDDAPAYGAMLIVNNRNTSAIRVAISAGDGIRSVLGTKKIDIAASSVAVISLADTMRYLNKETENNVTVYRINVALTDTSDAALGSTPLASVDVLPVKN